jgi:hypothetical protein
MTKTLMIDCLIALVAIACAYEIGVLILGFHICYGVVP